jgi:hypothetical protein
MSLDSAEAVGKEFLRILKEDRLQNTVLSCHSQPFLSMLRKLATIQDTLDPATLTTIASLLQTPICLYLKPIKIVTFVVIR